MIKTKINERLISKNPQSNLKGKCSNNANKEKTIDGIQMMWIDLFLLNNAKQNNKIVYTTLS